ncbi:MAG: hypothetical protein EWV82_19235 [Microcystis aeruginosa Ma_AC_P_19900807_S299]|uniref:Uncharacterized protein n=1 Tax=Microcystis aeruginosa Ma_SC_T_19800800_S464 TaxID=2486257 RepID=A0A552DQS7_MICAE|nr:MAG: hypothetical protein EWV82_19235 [Microcystis aeruginosa Ma_AC_P_19900807_S299]TRU24595.1 MAG: hypothetical protein EWV81_13800 [Microcystis aeruginosa Ma_SC_T_19800800_S464]
MFRGRKPSKTWLQKESLTLEINDIIGDHQFSDHYTANSRESLHPRYSQRYSHFQGEMYPVTANKGFVNFLVFLYGGSVGINS